MVTIRRQSTRPTLMPALAQPLGRACSANACLTCAVGIDLFQHTSSIFRFVREHVEKGRPSGIINGLGEHSACQPFDVQIFDGDNLIVIDEPTRNLVLKVPTLICDVKMRARQELNLCGYIPRSLLRKSYRILLFKRRSLLRKKLICFPATVRAFLSSCYFALSASQPRLRFSIPTRIVNLCAVAQGSERKQANVNAYLLAAFQQKLRLGFSRENNEPSVSLSLDGACLNLSFNWTREAQSHASYFRQMQLVAFQTKAALWIRERAIARLGTKARITRRLFCFDAPEECEKGIVEAAQCVLRHLRIDARNSGVRLAYVRQFNALLSVGNGLAPKFVGVSALLKSGVVQVAAQAKRVLESFGNALGCSQLVFIRPHALSMP